MSGHGRVMQIEMQIVVIKRNLRRYNPWLQDVSLVPGPDSDEEEWEDELDSSLTLTENLKHLEERYPTVRWRARRKPVRRGKPIRWKSEDAYAGRNADSYKLRVVALVKPHETKAKGKTYRCGRIQLTLNEKFIGQKAKVSVFIKGAGDANKTLKAIEPVRYRFGKRSGKAKYFNP